MSVFNHDYRPYEGRLTPLRSRPLVLARYALNEAWSSKITIGLFVLSLLPCLVDLVIMYVADNPMARALIMRGAPALDINETFFLRVLETQCWFALVLAAWIAPRLVSFDLGDNALPILLSHPISRFGYLLGKFFALALSLSYVTWIPCLILFVYQCYASPQPWGMAHLSLALGIFAGAAVWILAAFDGGASGIGVGEVAGDCDGGDFCGGVCSGGRGRHRQCNSADQVGIAAESSVHDVGTLAADARRARADPDE